MDEVLGYLNLYKESFPENPAFAAGAGKKKKEGAAEEKPVATQPAEPAVDVNKVVSDALGLVADTVIFATLNGEGVELKGSNQQINDAIAHVRKAWTGLTNGVGTWSSAKGNFVDTFSNLVFKSVTQVGTNTSRSYADLNAFISAFSASEGQALLAGERTVAKSPEPVQEPETAAVEEHEEHKAESTPEEQKEGAVAAEGENAGLLEKEGGDKPHYRGRGRGGRGRGNFFRKHNQDDEGFTVVKDEENQHYPSRRQRGGGRGGFRGAGRGGERGSGEFRGRGNRGSRGGEGRPHTEHKPRGRGEVRTGEFHAPAGDAPATTTAAETPATQ